VALPPADFSAEGAATSRLRSTFHRWVDSQAATRDEPDSEHVDWLRVIPFVCMHVACIGVFWVGWSATALVVAAALYAVRMFAITAFYHRCFSHRAFRTSRAVQFVFALVGAAAAQRGPLWWAAHHRHHHAHADGESDVHSPRRGFWWSHLGWFLTSGNFATRRERIPDLARFPELRFLDRYDALVPVLLAAGLYGLGELLERTAPELNTTGAQLLVWGFFISTVVLYHMTFTVNSLAHRFGTRRFATNDDSRNNWMIAIATLGEGWHNNHHAFPGSARQGLRWWEVDVTWYVLRLFAAVGIVWDVRPAPASARRSE
jgi:stearoyl-CoA desaturase (Delta-9 desaturase)